MGGDGVLHGGERRRPALAHVGDEVLHLAIDRVGIGAVGLGVGVGRLVLHPVTVAVAGGAVGADCLHLHGPGIARVVVGGETGLQMSQRARPHSQVHHGDVFLGDLPVVQGRLHGGELARAAGEEQQNVGVMGQDLADHPRKQTCYLLGVVNVVEHVHRYQAAQSAALDQFSGALHPVLVDVVVPRHAHQSRRFCGRRHLLDLGHGDADRLLHQHVLARRQGLQRQLVMGFQVGEHVHRVDGGIRQQLGHVVVAGATVGLRLLLGPLRRAVPQPHQARPGTACHRLGVQVGHHPRTDESDSQLLHASAKPPLRVAAQGAEHTPLPPPRPSASSAQAAQGG